LKFLVEPRHFSVEGVRKPGCNSTQIAVVAGCDDMLLSTGLQEKVRLALDENLALEHVRYQINSMPFGVGARKFSARWEGGESQKDV
jgi:hypothetical protein